MGRERSEVSRPGITVRVSVSSTPYNPPAKDNEARFTELVHFVRRNHVDNRPGPWKDPAKAREYTYRRVLPVQGRAEYLETLIADATRNKFVWDALKLIAEQHLRDRDLPDMLSDWLAEMLAGRRNRPRKGSRTELQQREMYLAVYHVVSRFGLLPTRRGSDSSNRDGMASAAGGSACDVVAYAFNTGYKNAERAWLNRDPILSYKKPEKN